MTQIKINEKSYEVLSFSAKITNKSIPVHGIGLAQGYLAVADNYRIYNTMSGEPLLRCRFSDLNLCLWLAENLEKVYRDYFDIWKAYPKADILSWCKYTVENGAWWYELKELLDKLDVVTIKDIEAAQVQASKLIEKWRIKT